MIIYMIISELLLHTVLEEEATSKEQMITSFYYTVCNTISIQKYSTTCLLCYICFVSLKTLKSSLKMWETHPRPIHELYLFRHKKLHVFLFKLLLCCERPLNRRNTSKQNLFSTLHVGRYKI